MEQLAGPLLWDEVVVCGRQGSEGIVQLQPRHLCQIKRRHIFEKVQENHSDVQKHVGI